MSKLVDYKRDDVHFTMREDTHDKLIIDQTWGGSYKWYMPEAGMVCIDIGAHIGAYALWAWSKGATVYAYEPESENFAMLCENIRRNEAFSVTVQNVAVMGQAGVVSLYKWSKSKGNTGSYGMYYGQAQGAEAQEVRAVTLADVLDMSGPADVLKLDCEGAEYDILLRAPQTALDKVKRICMEWHRNVDLAHELRDFLEGRGFKVEIFNTICRENLKDGAMYEYGVMDAKHG